MLGGGRDDSLFGVGPGHVVPGIAPGTKPQASFASAPHSTFNSQSGQAGTAAPGTYTASGNAGAPSVPDNNFIGGQGTGLHGGTTDNPILTGILNAGNYMRYGMNEDERQNYMNTTPAPGYRDYAYVGPGGTFDEAANERYNSAYLSGMMWKPSPGVQDTFNEWSGAARQAMADNPWMAKTFGVGPERYALTRAQEAGMRAGAAASPGSVLGQWGMPDANAAGFGGGNNPNQNSGNYDPNNPNNAPGPPTGNDYISYGYNASGGGAPTGSMYIGDQGTTYGSGFYGSGGGNGVYGPGAAHDPQNTLNNMPQTQAPDWTQAGYGPNPGDTTPAAPGTASNPAGSYAPPYSGFQGQSMFNPYSGQYNGPTSANFYATNMG